MEKIRKVCGMLSIKVFLVDDSRNRQEQKVLDTEHATYFPDFFHSQSSCYNMYRPLTFVRRQIVGNILNHSLRS